MEFEAFYIQSMAERRNVPQCNWRNFDAELADVMTALRAEPDRYDEFASYWWWRIGLLRKHDMSSIPPALIRLEGESTEEYIERRYAAGGYICPAMPRRATTEEPSTLPKRITPTSTTAESSTPALPL